MTKLRAYHPERLIVNRNVLLYNPSPTAPYLAFQWRDNIVEGQEFLLVNVDVPR